MTSADIDKTVMTRDGIGTLQGVAEIPGEGTFATVLVGRQRLVYEVAEICLHYPDHAVVQFERQPDEGLL